MKNFYHNDSEPLQQTRMANSHLKKATSEGYIYSDIVDVFSAT